MNPLAVLVADDEEEIRHLLERMLKPMGCAVTCVVNGAEVVAQLKRGRFDLIVTDILMPGGDGFKLIGEIRKIQPDARILAISGGGRFMDSRNYLKIARTIGADAAGVKPFDRDLFMAGVSQAMAPRAAPCA